MKKLIFIGVFLLLPVFSAGAADQRAINAAKDINKTVNTSVSSDSAFKENVASPMTAGGNDGVMMKTYDGKETFSANISAKSTTVFLEVLAQPGAGGDIGTIKIWQDINFDNTKDYNYDVPFNVSGVCANGLISCTPGTWSQCKYYEWTADAEGKVSTGELGSMNDLGGCYCVNNSCGAGLSWSNIDVILKDLGAGIVGAVQTKKPEFTVTEVKIDTPTIKYFGRMSQVQYVNEKGEEIGDQQASQAALVVKPEGITETDDNAGQSQKAAQFEAGSNIEEGGREAMLNQSQDPSSHYATFNNLLDESETRAEQSSCTVRREVFHDIEQQTCEVASIANPATYIHHEAGVASMGAASATQLKIWERNGASKTLSFNNVVFETIYLHPQHTSNGVARIEVLNDPVENSTLISGFTTSWECNGGDGETTSGESYKIFTVKAYNVEARLYAADGTETTSLAGLGYATGLFTCHLSTKTFSKWRRTVVGEDSIGFYRDSVHLGRLVFISKPICPIDTAIACDANTPPQCRQLNGVTDSVSNGCQAYENDSTCKVFEEKVDGVTLVTNQSSTGLIPQSSCKTYQTTMGNKQECRDWWVKERKYHCQVERENYTFEELGERSASVHTTLDAKGNFIDKRYEDGTFTSDNMSVDVNPVDAGTSDCRLVCKTEAPTVNTDTSLTTQKSEYQRNMQTLKTYYRDCGWDKVCPLELPGEKVVKGCQCLNEFAEATTVLMMMETAGNDMICSKDAPK